MVAGKKSIGGALLNGTASAATAAAGQIHQEQKTQTDDGKKRIQSKTREFDIKLFLELFEPLPVLLALRTV